jgi:hypothetical protein
VTNDSKGESYDINELWRYARMDKGLLEAERRVRPVVPLQGGGSGCGCGDASASMDCPVVYPADWDAWDGVERRKGERRVGAPQVLIGPDAVTDPQFRRSGSDRRGVVYPSDWDPREYAEWSDQVNQAQEERMAWEREVDALYAAEEVERMAQEASERRDDH